MAAGSDTGGLTFAGALLLITIVIPIVIPIVTVKVQLHARPQACGQTR